MPSWITSLFSPVADIFKARERRKAAREAAVAKLASATAQNAQQLELNKDEWEALQVKGMGETWRDEYITLSVGSILNIIVIGGVASAFGYTQILEGVGVAIQALTAAGVDVGFLLEATVLSGLGLSVWKRA